MLENVLSRRDVEVRVVESLPWLMVEYYDPDWLHCNVGPRKASCAKVKNGSTGPAPRAKESLPGLVSAVERRWLRPVRPADARHWNLPPDLDAEHLPYAA